MIENNDKNFFIEHIDLYIKECYYYFIIIRI